MKNIKTDIRNSLKESSLCDFMVIQLESAPIESFDPTEAIHLWNTQSTRGRRSFFKDDEKPQRHPPLLDIPMAEPKGTVKAENAEVEIPPTAAAEDTDVAVPTLAVESEETEVEEECDQEEGAPVGGKVIESDDVSGDDSGLESDCDDDEEKTNAILRNICSIVQLKVTAMFMVIILLSVFLRIQREMQLFRFLFMLESCIINRGNRLAPTACTITI